MGIMKVGENEYYTISDILKCNANWNIVYSERSSGKSYQGKIYMIEQFMKYGAEGAVIRRFDYDLNSATVGTYWDDVQDFILELAYEKWPQYEMFQVLGRAGSWKLRGILSNGEKEDLGVLAHYFALNTMEHYKSSAYPNVTTIIYEEFMTRPGAREIEGELDLLMNMVSTIKRKRTNVKIFMFGNTINTHSKLLIDMGIDIKRIKHGEIKLYQYFGEGDVVNTVAVEWPLASSQSAASESYFTFNRQQEAAIIKGEFQTKAYRHFKPNDISRNLPELALSIEDDYDLIYIYIYDQKSNYYCYVTDERIMNRCEYIRICDEPTSESRGTINNKSQQAKQYIKLLQYLYSHDWVSYNNNITGCNYERIIDVD